MRTTLLWLMTAALVALGGCATVHETYAGKDRAQVWTAMVAVAENPTYYPDWFITTNEVWVDSENDRIEIYRIIERDVVIPLGNPQHQKRVWKHQIRLLEGEEGEPMIEFVSRAIGVPAEAKREGRLFFRDVWEILGGAPWTVEEQRLPPAESAEDLIDIEEMDGL